MVTKAGLNNLIEVVTKSGLTNLIEIESGMPSQIMLFKHSSILTSQIVPFHPILHVQSPLVLLQSAVLVVIQEQLLEQLNVYFTSPAAQ
jgi:hypothetical protein